jgi:acetolactate synthase I/II/III large subunit
MLSFLPPSCSSEDHWAISTDVVSCSPRRRSLHNDCTQQLSANWFRESPDTGHLVWIDGTYDVAGGQELEKYRRESEVAFGPVDTVKYAGAFGATGLMIRTPDEIAPVLKRAFEIEGPVLIGVHADYCDNHVRLCVQKNSIV